MEDAEEIVAPLVRRLRWRAVKDRLRESLLFLPGLLLLGGVLLEVAAVRADDQFDLAWLDVAQMTPAAAQTLLATIAGATVTTAGVVFSLLVVSLQLASGQFSPRVLRTFWRDRVGQFLIGLLLSTFAFCVLALGQVDTGGPNAPPLTMTLTILLAGASIFAIVGYLNRIIRHQYVGRIMEGIMAEALDLIHELPYGPRMGRACGVPVPVPDLADLGAPLVVAAPRDGWVQQISREAVLAAVPPDSVVRLETRVGAYLLRGEPLARIWPKSASATQAAESARLIAEATIVGVARTMQQDIDFSLRQLNDIGLRALSAAVNDPTTAIEAILRVSSVVRPLLLAELPPQAVRDDAGRTLLTPWELDHSEYVRHAFGQVRFYAAGHPQVAVALARTVRALRDLAGSSDRLEAARVLDEELAALLENAARHLSEFDLVPLRSAATGAA